MSKAMFRVYNHIYKMGGMCVCALLELLSKLTLLTTLYVHECVCLS